MNTSDARPSLPQPLRADIPCGSRPWGKAWRSRRWTLWLLGTIFIFTFVVTNYWIADNIDPCSRGEVHSRAPQGGCVLVRFRARESLGGPDIAKLRFGGEKTLPLFRAASTEE